MEIWNYSDTVDLSQTNRSKAEIICDKSTGRGGMSEERTNDGLTSLYVCEN